MQIWQMDNTRWSSQDCPGQRHIPSPYQADLSLSDLSIVTVGASIVLPGDKMFLVECLNLVFLVLGHEEYCTFVSVLNSGKRNMLRVQLVLVLGSIGMWTAQSCVVQGPLPESPKFSKCVTNWQKTSWLLLEHIMLTMIPCWRFVKENSLFSSRHVYLMLMTRFRVPI